MCRIFGFKSVINSQVHQSLVQADNALMNQSENHPDGWGVAYYINGSPHIIKSGMQAIEDNIFKKVSGVVASQTVLAHIRKSTQGANNILNTHPFQFGQWTFAHNGNIKNFDGHRVQLVGKVDRELRRFILGDTDSEVLFFLLLTEIKRLNLLSERSIKLSDLNQCTHRVLNEVTKIIGPCFFEDPKQVEETFLTFIITNGETMLAHQGGQPLKFSTYKNKCTDREICPYFSDVCEASDKGRSINHLIFSSEPLSGDNIWLEMEPHQIIGVDSEMILSKEKFKVYEVEN